MKQFSVVVLVAALQSVATAESVQWHHHSLAQVAERGTDQAEQSEGALLHSDLINAEHKQKQMRHRLSEISQVAHQGLMDLHRALEQAREAAALSLGKSSSQLATFQHLAAQEKAELVATKRSTSFEMNRLASEERSVQTLRSSLKAAEHLEQQLSISAKSRSQYGSHLAAAQQMLRELRIKVAAAENMATQAAAGNRVVRSLQQKLQSAQRAESAERARRAAADGTYHSKIASITAAMDQDKAKAARAEKDLQQTVSTERTEAQKLESTANSSEAQLRMELAATSNVNGGLLAGINNSKSQEQTLNATLAKTAGVVRLLKANVSLANASKASIGTNLSKATTLLDNLNAASSRFNESVAMEQLNQSNEHYAMINKVQALHQEASDKSGLARQAEVDAKSAQERANETTHQRKMAEQKVALLHSKDVKALREHLSAVKADLHSVQEEEQSTKQSSSVLAANLSKVASRVQGALLQTGSLQKSNSQIATQVTLLKNNLSSLEASLMQTTAQASASEQSLADAKFRLSAQTNATNHLRALVASLQKERLQSNKSMMQANVQAQKQLKDVMLAADSQIKSLTRQNASLRADIVKMNAEERRALADAAKAKDTLVQETDLALESGQKVESLTQSLQDAQRFADANSSKLNSLEGEVDGLREERARAQALLQQRSKDNSMWHTKELSLENRSKDVANRLKKAAQENKVLRAQLQDYSGQGERASQLEEMIGDIRSQAQKNASRRLEMAHELQDLRDLKDRYSSEYEAWRNESDTWHNRATDLDAKIKLQDKRLRSAIRLRNKAADKAKEANSHDDEYSQENSRLQQANDGLRQELLDTGAKANRSIASESDAQHRYNEMKAAEKKEQDEYNTKWVKNEHDLIQTQHDLKEEAALQHALEGELQQTRALLSDKQRQALGLPLLKPTQKPLGGQARSAQPTNAFMAQQNQPALGSMVDVPMLPEVPVVALPEVPVVAALQFRGIAAAAPAVSPELTESFSSAATPEPLAAFDQAPSTTKPSLRQASFVQGSNGNGKSILQDLTAYFSAPLPSN